MVFADTFQIKYKLNFNNLLKKGSAVKHFLEKKYLDLSNKTKHLAFISIF